MTTHQPLRGRIFVVTGATGGLGAAICEAAAAAGASVVIGFNQSPHAALSLAEALPTAVGAQHLPIALPVTDTQALRMGAACVADCFDHVDVLVNCASTTRVVPHHDLDALDDALFDDILSTNIRGPFATVRAFRTLLERAVDGLVINVSSTAAQTAIGSNIAYCASKAALDNMTLSMARALAPRIRVVSVSSNSADIGFLKAEDQSFRQLQCWRMPLGKLASADDVADAVLAAVTLKFTTGTVLPVDGVHPFLLIRPSKDERS